MDILNIIIIVGIINIVVICIRLFDTLLDSQSLFDERCYCSTYRRNHFVIAIGFLSTSVLAAMAMIFHPIADGLWQVVAGMNIFAQTMGLGHLLKKEKNRHKYHKCQINE